MKRLKYLIPRTDPYAFISKSLSFGAVAIVLIVHYQQTALCQQTVPGVEIPDSNGAYKLYIGSGDQKWPGTWNKTNGGLQDKLTVYDLETDNPKAVVFVGSRVMNSGGDYFSPIGGKYLKFELRDSNGVLIPPRNAVPMESTFARLISINELLRAGGDHLAQERIVWFTNGWPPVFDHVALGDIFRIQTEGDYTLSICPIIFRRETNQMVLHQIELPWLITNIHLLKDERPPPHSALGGILIPILKCVCVVGGLFWIVSHRHRIRM